MQVTVTGRQLDVGDALRSHVEEGLSNAVGKYFDKPMEAAVKFSRNGHDIHADIQVHVGRGILVHGGAEGGDAYGAFNEAAEHIAKRLRRYKSRLRDHHMDEARALESEMAQKFILSGEQAGEEDADEAAGTEPAVIAELETEVPTLTVGDAVMRMDLANLPAMMFRNPAHGGLNMIYRRPDGNIGWVDPRGVRENTTKA
jgi:ribosomal subunit interface protein